MSWRASARPAVLVAEALRRVPDPPAVATPPFGPGTAAVAGAIARSLTPPEAADPPPRWLRPAQRATFARALEAVRRHGGAMIAEPVGAGKTWVALAVAACEGGRAVAVVPALLRDQWARAAARAAVPLAIQTHEGWSRRPRDLPPGLVVIDESHRFRNPGIRRYLHLSRALVGRAGLLLTATPAVNRLEDVGHQLLLFLRDDALAASGVSSLSSALQDGPVPPQLADLIISGAAGTDRPEERARSVAARPEEEAEAAAALQRLDPLALASSPATRRLLSGVFLSALASSPAALVAALRRYRALLCQCGDAARGGVSVSRAALRSLLGGDPDQTLLWPLLATLPTTADLPSSDLALVDDCLAWFANRPSGSDGKVDRLRSVLGDGIPAVVFTRARATVDYLRRSLPQPIRIAWCTGESAGIGRGRLPRDQVLRWFGPGAPASPLRPAVLVTTDLAAEGLDLQYAGRIVHYDLPWTAVRLDQRTGRALRPGGVHGAVEVVTLLPPVAIETRLLLLARLARKRPLPGRIGLGPRPAPAWRWRTAFLERWREPAPERGAAILHSTIEAAAVGIELVSRRERVAGLALARMDGSAWTDDPEVLECVLRAAAAARRAPDDPAAVMVVLRTVHRHVRLALLGATGGLWRIRPVPSWCRAALARLRRKAEEAVRARDPVALSLVDRGIGFLRRGHTAGERALALGLAEAEEARVDDLLAGLPPPDGLPAPMVARVTGVLVLKPAWHQPDAES